MRRPLVALALLVALAGCAKHPTITAGVTGGTIGFSACYLDVEKAGTCGIVGGSAALFLGGLVAIVTYFTDTSAHELKFDDDEEMRPVEREPLDAGVDAAPPDAAARAADSGVDSAP